MELRAASDLPPELGLPTDGVGLFLRSLGWWGQEMAELLGMGDHVGDPNSLDTVGVRQGGRNSLGPTFQRPTPQGFIY